MIILGPEGVVVFIDLKASGCPLSTHVCNLKKGISKKRQWIGAVMHHQ